MDDWIKEKENKLMSITTTRLFRSHSQKRSVHWAFLLVLIDLDISQVVTDDTLFFIFDNKFNL